jgi:hypothetical protein
MRLTIKRTTRAINRRRIIYVVISEVDLGWHYEISSFQDQTTPNPKCQESLSIPCRLATLPALLLSNAAG